MGTHTISQAHEDCSLITILRAESFLPHILSFIYLGNYQLPTQYRYFVRIAVYKPKQIILGA